MTSYVVTYRNRQGEEILEGTPFADLDDALARTRFLIVNNLAELGSVKLDITTAVSPADALERVRRDLAATLPEGDSQIGPYTVTLEAMSDPGDPSRGAWVECWVATTDGRFSNSLACLEGEGEFDDGPKISGAMLDRITAFAHKYGY